MKLVRYLTSSMILILASNMSGNAQVIGGTHAFEFLNLSNSAHVSALGGLTPALTTQDVSLAWQNPALYRPGLHNQLSFNYNAYYANIKVMNLQYAYYVPKWKTTFGGGVQNVNYGDFQAADIYGNSLGNVRANDLAINLSASRAYGAHWRYGATLKYAHSVLAELNAAAILTDIGLSYVDTSNKFMFGIVAKNIGGTINRYNNNNPAEPLPFDLNIGISKELKNLPLKVFIVGHHLYQWDIRYNNPADKKTNVFSTDTSTKSKTYFADKLFRHINLGAELTLGKRLGVCIAYNHLRRSELGTSETKGMAGFSLGASLYLNKLQIHYGRSIMATAGAYNEFGLNLSLDKFIGVGKKTEPWHWENKYPNW